jgi:hypothetical protein
MGGFVNSDHMRSKGFIPAMTLILSTKYTSKDNRNIIDEFLNDVLYYSGTGLDDLEEDVVEDMVGKFDELFDKLI